jgi:hypothetical protein
VGILERNAEGCPQISKFSGQRIRIFDVDEGIQPQVGVTLAVRHRHYVSLGLNEYLRSIAADDGKKSILLRLPKPGLKAKLVAVKSDSPIDVADDEGRLNCRQRWSRHRQALSY